MNKAQLLAMSLLLIGCARGVSPEDVQTAIAQSTPAAVAPVEVTRIVEMTREVEVTRLAQIVVTATPTATPLFTQTDTLTPSQTFTPSQTMTPTITPMPGVFVFVEGKGDVVTDNYTWKGCVKAIFTWTAAGRDNMIVLLWSVAQADETYLINEIGPGEGQALQPVEAGEYYFEIRGPSQGWTITGQCKD